MSCNTVSSGSSMADQTTNPIPSQVRPLAKRTSGRPPSVFRPELATVIIERIADGETLSSICAGDGMPSPTTFRRWALAHEEVWEAFQAARELKADSLFDEALDLARSIKANPGTSQHVRAYDVAMSHLRWAAGKLNPQRYSDRSQITFTVPIQINTTLDLGQGGGGSITETGAVYDLTAKVVEEGEVVEVEKKKGGKK